MPRVTVRMDERMAGLLRERASRARRSVTAEIALLLEEALAADLGPDDGGHLLEQHRSAARDAAGDGPDAVVPGALAPPPLLPARPRGASSFVAPDPKPGKK